MSSSLEAELLQEQQLLRQLKAEQAALKAQLQAGRTKRLQPRSPWQGLQQLFSYLASSEQHPHLGLPCPDLPSFMSFLETHDLAAIGTLGKHVLPQHTLSNLRNMMRGDYIADDGPFQGGLACFHTQAWCTFSEVDVAHAAQMNVKMLKGNAVIRGAFQGFVKAWARGMFAPAALRTIMYHRTAPTSLWMGYHMLVLVKMPQDPSMPHGPIPDSVQGKLRMEQLLARDGLPRVLLLMMAEPPLHGQDMRLMSGAFRELMDLSHAPVLMVTCDAQGHVLKQNTFSLAHMGVLAREHFMDEGTACTEPGGSDSAATHAKPTLNYLRELLGSEISVQEALMTVNTTGTYRERVCLTSPVLRQFMHVDTDEEVYFDVHIGRLLDGITKQLTYVIVQVDVTKAVMSQKQAEVLKRNQELLLSDMLPQEVTDALLSRSGADPRVSSAAYSDPSQIHKKTPFSVICAQLAYPMAKSVSDAAMNGLRAVKFDFYTSIDESQDLIKTVSNDIAGHAHESGGLARSSMPFSCSDLHQLSASDLARLSHYNEQVSVLFIAIQGFSSISRRLHACEVIHMLNDLFSTFDSLIGPHDVYKVESIGDVYMVASGLFDRPGHVDASEGDRESHTSTTPSRRSDQVLGGSDPYHATKILDFAKAVMSGTETLVDSSNKPVQLLVGLHAGPIMTGVVGTHVPRFCCFGDTVNTASRMETTARPGLIHASAAFRDLTPDEPWEPTGGVTVKGKGNMETYTLKHDKSWHVHAARASRMSDPSALPQTPPPTLLTHQFVNTPHTHTK